MNYINDIWVSGKGAPFTSENPCDESIIWQGEATTSTEVLSAYEAARNALPTWSRLTVNSRYAYIQTWIDKLNANKAAIIKHLSLETGKPFWEAEQEINAVIDKPTHALAAYKTRLKESTLTLTDHHLHLRYKPIGVVAILGAFNFPLHLSYGHILPALIAGNTAVYKPSELTPAINEIIMHYWQESGLPKGVLNLVQGGADTAQSLIACPIDAVYFTGSYATGQKIHGSLQLRPEVLLALEMGGNNPLILGEVSHLDAAVYQTLVSTFISAGQRCSCARRLIIPNSNSGDTYLSKLVDAAKHIVLGAPGSLPVPFMGPVIRRTHAQNHLDRQAHLIQQGYEPLLPMQLLGNKGAFLSPGILLANHAIEDEELFAPLVQVYRYDSFEEALKLANQTKYGLTAGLFSDSLKQYEYFYDASRAGVLTWNRPTTGASSRMPFGGVGKSGNHRPCAYFASDYTATPVACAEQLKLMLPTSTLPGIYSG